MKTLYIISTVGGFDKEASNVKAATKLLMEHASQHPNIKMGIYKLVKTGKFSRYSNGKVRWSIDSKDAT